MGAALELLSGGVASLTGSTTFDALTLSTGNVLTIRNCPLDRKVWLLGAWAVAQGAATIRIRSPRLHDNVQGMRFQVPATTVYPFFPFKFKQLLIPQDTLIVEANGTAGQAITTSLLVYYEELPGINSRFAAPDFVYSKMEHVMNVENTFTATSTTTYAGEEAINAEFDLMKANTDYALLGFKVSNRVQCVRWRGADIGNLGIGGPGIPDDFIWTSEFFCWLSQWTGFPLIPIINSANKAGVLVDGIAGYNQTTVTLTSIFAQLRP